MTRRRISRREFIQNSAVAAGAYAASTVLLEPEGPAWARAARLVPASDQVRFGIIGVGMQGSGLLTNAIALPGVGCAWHAICTTGVWKWRKKSRAESADDATVSGVAREQRHRLRDRGGAGSLAQANRGGRLGRGKGRLLREADVALADGRLCDGERDAEVGSHRPSGSQRVAAFSRQKPGIFRARKHR